MANSVDLDDMARFRAISSGSTLFAMQYILVWRFERISLCCVGENAALFKYLYWWTRKINVPCVVQYIVWHFNFLTLLTLPVPNFVSFFFILTYYRLYVKLIDWMSNSVDPDETAQGAVSSGSMLFAKAYYYRLWQWKSCQSFVVSQCKGLGLKRERRNSRGEKHRNQRIRGKNKWQCRNRRSTNMPLKKKNQNVVCWFFLFSMLSVKKEY